MNTTLHHLYFEKVEVTFNTPRADTRGLTYQLLYKIWGY